MFASLPARLVLIATLVLSQALYAGHSVQHDAGSQLDCQTCLQSSAGGAALACSSNPPAVPVYPPFRPAGYVAPAAPAYFTLSQPSRAPPLLPL